MTVISDQGGSDALLELLKMKLTEIATQVAKENNLVLIISGVERFGKFVIIYISKCACHTSVVRASTAKVKGLGFESQWLPKHFFSQFVSTPSCFTNSSYHQ